MSTTRPTILIIAVTLLIAAFAFLYFFTGVFGETRINLTIATNSDLETGLVAYYTFDGVNTDWSSSTAEILDSSPLQNNGNLKGLDSTFVKRGVIGQALSFVGSNGDYVDAPDKPSLDITGDLTFGGWVYLNDQPPGAGAGEDPRIIQKGDSSSAAAYILNISSTGGTITQPRFRYFTGSASDLQSTTNIPVREWVHIMAVREGTAMRIYINGELDKSGTGLAGSLNDESGGLNLGESPSNSNGALDGRLDDIRVYNRALSTTTIQRLYQLGATTHINESITTNPDLERGLVGHWTFDGVDIDWASTTAEVSDHSGNGNYGDADSLTNADVVPGVIGQALRFNGSDSYITVADSDQNSIGTNNLTVSVWVNPDDVTSNHGILDHEETGGALHEGHQVATNAGGTVRMRFNDDLGNFVLMDSATNIPAHAWSHLVWVADKSTTTGGKIYINGVQDANVYDVTAVTDINAEQDLYLGDSGGTSAPSNPFLGMIDDIRIYDRALSVEEVQRLYELGATTHIDTTIDTNPDLERGLVLHYTFDGADIDWSASNEILDSSSYGNVGDATNFGAEAAKRGRIGQALQFSPADDYIDFGTPASLVLTSAKTISAWIYPYTLGGSDFGTIYATDIVGGKEYFSMCNSDGTECPSTASTFVFNNRDSGGAAPNEWYAPANTIRLNEWQHIAVTYICDGSTARFYYNGEEVTATQSRTAGSGCGDTSATTKYIGGATNSVFDGLIDDVRIYNRALSPAEIKKLYELGE